MSSNNKNRTRKRDHNHSSSIQRAPTYSPPHPGSYSTNQTLAAFMSSTLSAELSYRIIPPEPNLERHFSEEGELRALDLSMNVNSSGSRQNHTPTQSPTVEHVQVEAGRCKKPSSGVGESFPVQKIKECLWCKQIIKEINHLGCFCKHSCFEAYRRYVYKRRTLCIRCGKRGDWDVNDADYSSSLESVPERICHNCTQNDGYESPPNELMQVPLTPPSTPSSSFQSLIFPPPAMREYPVIVTNSRVSSTNEPSRQNIDQSYLNNLLHHMPESISSPFRVPAPPPNPPVIPPGIQFEAYQNQGPKLTAANTMLALQRVPVIQPPLVTVGNSKRGLSIDDFTGSMPATVSNYSMLDDNSRQAHLSKLIRATQQKIQGRGFWRVEDYSKQQLKIEIPNDELNLHNGKKGEWKNFNDRATVSSPTLHSSSSTHSREPEKGQATLSQDPIELFRQNLLVPVARQSNPSEQHFHTNSMQEMTPKCSDIKSTQNFTEIRTHLNGKAQQQVIQQNQSTNQESLQSPAISSGGDLEMKFHIERLKHFMSTCGVQEPEKNSTYAKASNQIKHKLTTPTERPPGKRSYAKSVKKKIFTKRNIRPNRRRKSIHSSKGVVVRDIFQNQYVSDANKGKSETCSVTAPLNVGIIPKTYRNFGTNTEDCLCWCKDLVGELHGARAGKVPQDEADCLENEQFPSQLRSYLEAGGLSKIKEDPQFVDDEAKAYGNSKEGEYKPNADCCVSASNEEIKNIEGNAVVHVDRQQPTVVENY